MSVVLAAVLIIGGLVGTAIAVIAVPLLFGLMAHDVIESRKTAPAPVRDSHLRIAVERGIARGFVLAGGVFWSIAAFAGLYTFRQDGMTSSLLAALIPLVACIATLIVGWYFERTTAAFLAAASLAVIAYGVVFQFEMGVWMLMSFALIGPMLTAAALFWAARREQDAFEMATLTRLEIAPVFAARSSLAA